MKATINKTAETIALGDTLKITLVLPANIITESGQTIIVNSLQKGEYILLCSFMDTVNHRNIGLNNTPASFVTEGTNINGPLHMSTNSVPYRCVLNIVPTQKGPYYLEILPQPGKLNINSNSYYGLKVNFDVPDKHWIGFAHYFNGSNQPDFITTVTTVDNEGYGWYCFRVN